MTKRDIFAKYGKELQNENATPGGRKYNEIMERCRKESVDNGYNPDEIQEAATHFARVQEKEPSKARQLRDMTKMKRVQFCELYGIPLRTMEDWEAGRSNPPEYLQVLLERAVRQDLGMPSMYYVYQIDGDNESLILKTYNIIEAKKFARNVKEKYDPEIEIRLYEQDIEDEECDCFDYDLINY